MGGAAVPLLIGAKVGGGLFSYYANQREGQDQQSYYDYLAANNEQRANLALKRGEQAVTGIQDAASNEDLRYRQNVERVRGSQTAAIAGSGVSSGSATAEDIATDTTRAANMDEVAIRHNADMKSWATMTGAQDTAFNLRQEANQYRLAGMNARRAANLNADTSILGSATSIGDTWMNWGRTSQGKK